MSLVGQSEPTTNQNEASASYGIRTVTPRAFDEAVEAITAALKEQGFGVLTEIDVRATLKKKLDVDFRPYVILGACNPPLAYRALQTEHELGLLLPCNVIVYDNGDGTSTISVIDPLQMMSVTNNPDLDPIAADGVGVIACLSQRWVRDHSPDPLYYR